MAQKYIALLRKLQRAVKAFDEPMSVKIAHEYSGDPFLILMSCLLSLRARDTVTYRIAHILFKRAQTPQEMIKIPLKELEKIIHPIGTYRRKAHLLHDVSYVLLSQFHGKVPSDEQALLSIKGIGRKTANLVRGIAFGIPAICVDVHVHRIANGLGWVHTKTPEATERELARIIPKSWWIELNRLFVVWGQNHCKPVSAKRCAPGCPFSDLCPRVYWKK